MVDRLLAVLDSGLFPRCAAVKFWINSNDNCSDNDPLCVHMHELAQGDGGAYSKKRCENVFSWDLKIKPGMQLLLTDKVLLDGLRYDFEIENAPIELSYSIYGRTRYSIHKSKGPCLEMEREAGSCAMSILPNTHGWIEHPSGERFFNLTIFFSQAVFRELFKEWPEVLMGLGAGNSAHGFKNSLIYENPLDPRSLMILRQIINSPFQGSAAALYLEAKALELVAVKMDSLQSCGDKGKTTLSNKEMELVRQAHHILIKNRQNPPGLEELCRMVGLNRNKLNCGFKSLFGDTVFGVLQREKLCHAWSLLEQSDLPLVDIALEAGYKNQASFTRAFCNCFGCTPGSLRRTGCII
jgi:AraC-like DNA-binding protein